MQRLTSLRSGTARLSRVAVFQAVESFSPIYGRVNLLTFQRCLSDASSTNKDGSSVDAHAKLYKPSTAKEETHVPDELKGGQAPATFDTTTKATATLTGGGKVWSVQNPGSVHIAPLSAATTTFVPSSTDSGSGSHQTTVHSTQGKVNFADPFTTQALQPEATPGQLAEAAAASAFETYAPNTPLISSTTATDTVFAPKISSTDVYSSTSSPTADFQSIVPPTSSDTKTYETSQRSTVFGGHDTSASSKKQSNENPFETKSTDHSSSVNEIPIHRESDIRDNILREALKYVEDKGWTLDAIRAGIRDTQQPSTVEGLFSNGYDLVEYFIRDANAKMSTYMSERMKTDNLQGGRLLVEGLKYRLSLVIPYARTWDQALAQGALPQNAVRGWKNLLDLSSNAWHGIGDTSTDINWYTKRLLVAAVYKSAEIFMLQDQSPEKVETVKFLERRLSDFQAMGSVKNSVSKSLSDTAQIANGLLSVVRNLTSRR